jgi:hypothetical protein
VLRHTGDGSCLVAAWPAATHAPRLAALRFHPDAVTPSDADTLRALAARAAASAAPLLTHAAWLDALGRDALGTASTAPSSAPSPPSPTRSRPSVPDPTARADLALLTADPPPLPRVLEAKSWLGRRPGVPDAPLRRQPWRGAAASRAHPPPALLRHAQHPRAAPRPAARAFGRVPFLNGGLFAPTPLERRHRPPLRDEALGTLVHTVLAATASPPTRVRRLVEAAVDPEMLGRAFESLMSARERHATGAFYTPRPLVEHATTEALRHALAHADRGGAAPDRDAPISPASTARSPASRRRRRSLAGCTRA